MRKHFAILVCVILLALSLGGCTKCGWVWDDLRSCHGAPGPKQAAIDRLTQGLAARAMKNFFETFSGTDPRRTARPV